MTLEEDNPMQCKSRRNIRTLAPVTSFVLAGLGLSTSATAQTSGTYLKQLTIARVPEDVANTPSAMAWPSCVPSSETCRAVSLPAATSSWWSR